MANVIVSRVKEFLRKYPPFSFLSDELLSKVAGEVELMYFSKGEYLFLQGEPAKNHFYIVKEGFINLTEIQNNVPKIMEYCDEGDVFGVLTLLGKRPYILNAFAAEDSLVYAIPVSVFEKILQENNQVSLYFAAGFASGQVVVRSDLSRSQMARRFFTQESGKKELAVFSGQSPFRYTADVLTCSKGISVAEAAQKMSGRDVSSIVVVDSLNHPVGIITDKDLRNRLLAMGKPASIAVEEIMTHPVITIGRDSDFASLYLTVIKNRLHHLVITEDGTNSSRVIGIVSDHDILLSQGFSPSVIVHALMNTDEVAELGRLRDKAEMLLQYLLDNEVSIDFVANFITEINDVILQRAVMIAKKKHDQDFEAVNQVKFCFLSLGSEGRAEQLLRTDMDNAIVYEDVAEDIKPLAQQYLLAVANEVISIMMACGFQPCPADIMANNPAWCQPLSGWKKYFDHWISSPDQDSLLKACTFFDFRSVYGEDKLAEQMSLHIFHLVEKKKIFLNFLAKNALLNPPPLGFFRNFVVEKSGAHQDKFDIKLRAMMPLIDAARLLILSHNVLGINNTLKRFERLAELEPENREVFREAGKAYEIFMRIRVMEGLKSKDSGRFIQPESLGKLQRQLLKNAFIPIDELQKIIRIRFQLDFLGS
jgi:CBS domain-containing protein